MTLCCAIGAVVLGEPTTSQTPLSGHRSPVLAVVPIGAFISRVSFFLVALGSWRASLPPFEHQSVLKGIAPQVDISGKFFSEIFILGAGIFSRSAAGIAMRERFEEIIAAADWKNLTPRLMYYADSRIRRCAWRGVPVQATAEHSLSVEGLSASDFVQEALDRLLNNRRRYNFDVDLEQNLRGVIKSLVWNLNKSSLISQVTELRPSDSAPDDDPLDTLPGKNASPSDLALRAEAIKHQRERLDAFEQSIADDPDLLKIFGGLKQEETTPRNLEKLTGIPAARISELKRKLRRRMERFIEGSLQP